jgi:hypothetical protein
MLVCAAITAVGTAGVGGWILRSPELISVVLVELLLDRSVGVDFGFLHAWYDYGNTRPGRMAPNSAIGFILVGSGILLADRVTSRNRGIGAVLVTFCALAVGLTGLVGYARRICWRAPMRRCMPRNTRGRTR